MLDIQEKILKRSIHDVGKLQRSSSSIAPMIVERLKVEDRILERSIIHVSKSKTRSA